MVDDTVILKLNLWKWHKKYIFIQLQNQYGTDPTNWFLKWPLFGNKFTCYLIILVSTSTTVSFSFSLIPFMPMLLYISVLFSILLDLLQASFKHSGWYINSFFTSSFLWFSLKTLKNFGFWYFQMVLKCNIDKKWVK